MKRRYNIYLLSAASETTHEFDIPAECECIQSDFVVSRTSKVDHRLLRELGIETFPGEGVGVISARVPAHVRIYLEPSPPAQSDIVRMLQWAGRMAGY